MYISCKVTSTPMEQETGYIPNNPLFGITLDSPQDCLDTCVGCVSCQNSTLPSLNSTDLDCDNCFDQNFISLGSTQGNTQNYWNQDEMNSSFPGLPPLDIDPLPSLFPFPSCGSSYNFSAPQTSLSYTVHPQMLLSPNHHFNQNSNQNNHHINSHQSYYDTNQLTSMPNPTQPQPAPPAPPPPPPSMYPSMSVNMSVTMHGYPPTENAVPLQCSQWNPSPSSSVNVLYPQIISSPHYTGGTTYCSFTADFRPSNQNAQQMNNFAEQNKSPQLTQRQFHHHQLSQLSPKSNDYIHHENSPKLQLPIGYDEDEDSNDGSDSNNKPNLCGICGKSYARPSTLKTHLRTHSGERPYRCNQCNKSFSQAANLTAHVRTHTGQKPFKCHICDRRFSQSSSVTTHMRTHSGERPYRCREKNCKKAFSDSSTLTKHLRIHSGEKPYECKLCCLRFSQSGNLNRHMRIHGTNGNIS